MAGIAGHILVTRGRRPSNLEEALASPHSRVQARIIQKVAVGLKVATGERPHIVFLADKANCIESLSSLPVLERYLDDPEKNPLPVLIADIAKVFAQCPPGSRDALLTDLLAYGDRIKLLFGGRRLNLPQLPESFWPALLDPQSFRSVHQSIRVKASTDQAMRADWTEPGRAESERVRGEHPDRLAHQFRRIRDELLEQTGRATHPEIAELANAQGLLTSRGRPIRPDTVSRALKRLDPE